MLIIFYYPAFKHVINSDLPHKIKGKHFALIMFLKKYSHKQKARWDLIDYNHENEAIIWKLNINNEKTNKSKLYEIFWQ